MVLLIDSTVDTVADTAFRSMFAARKSVFIDLLKWDLPVLDGRYEIDQFDDQHARYLILTDSANEHLASARLLPTTRPHILDGLFPALCAGEIPRGPRVWEITRFCLGRQLRSTERRQVRNQLVSALTSHALVTGIDTYTGVAEMAWLQQILSFGWQCRALGEPLANCGCLLGALEITITPDTPTDLAAGGVWSPLTAHEMPARRAANA
ncbi:MULTISPECIES: acyl-homoserine-lactone synthase [unclassified Sphingomonas]|jgi:N-acyl-L-homoserine lactone synthetase|uniref:acyl-homoserine-lactone synthase n=1 Tax=Sphingomonas TaxID=13687 RepID=UPI00095C7F3B|nr:MULTISPECIES: acyl-homoserine-lactone synthase [unclassified Sphingomonas]MBN8813468.1 autoinducer synthase [Sphingomonas sp.]OJY52468.1 MAG: autoinducer synthase [Sphingomonas sp. 67-41]